MKNLMIYISPTGSFNNPRKDLASNDAGQLAKVQIENSLELGWKKKDILFFTNFNWQYGSIRSRVINKVEFFDKRPQASKINAIVKLFEKGLISDEELYWFHDLDAFQLEVISENELELDGFDMGLTDYGRLPVWNTGTIFFKKSSEDIFKKLKKIIYEKISDEEKALYKLTSSNKKINRRIKKLNKTYNFTPFNLRPSYKMADKPIKVVHFHPLAGVKQLGIENALKFYLGENKIHTPLLTRRFYKILKYHRIG